MAVSGALTNYLKITNILNDNDDLNTIMTNGRYQIAAKKVINAPADFYTTEKIYGFLEVQKYDSYTSQILTVYIEGVVHIAGRRHTAGATWSEWKKLTTETEVKGTYTSDNNGIITTDIDSSKALLSVCCTNNTFILLPFRSASTGKWVFKLLNTDMTVKTNTSVALKYFYS